MTIKQNDVAALWIRMAATYGYKWASNHGAHDTGNVWLEGLSDLTAPQLLIGLQACVSSRDAWPPSLPEFRQLCLGGGSALEMRDRVDAQVARICEAVRDDARDRLDAADTAILSSVSYWDQRHLPEPDFRRRIGAAARASIAPDGESPALPSSNRSGGIRRAGGGSLESFIPKSFDS